MDDQEQFRADLSLVPQVLKLCKALCASGQNDSQQILNAVSDITDELFSQRSEDLNKCWSSSYVREP